MSMTVARAAYANYKAGTGSFLIGLTGDSLEECEGASALNTRWIYKFAKKLIADAGKTGEPAIGIPAYAWGTYLSASASWHTAATSQGGGQPSAFITQGDKGVYLASGTSSTYSITGDSMDVLYLQWNSANASAFGITPGTLSVYVDGSATPAASWSTLSSTWQPSQVHHVSLGSNTTHSVRVAASGGDIIVDQFIPYQGNYGNAIVVMDNSHTGYTAAQFSNTTSPNEDWRLGWKVFQPHLVLDGQNGGNDFINVSSPPSTSTVAGWVTDRFTMYNALTGTPSVMLIIPPVGSGSTSWTAGGKHISDYFTANIAAATSAGASVYDSRTDLGYPASNTLFVAEPDGTTYLHPNDTGQNTFANLLAAAVEPAATSSPISFTSAAISGVSAAIGARNPLAVAVAGQSVVSADVRARNPISVAVPASSTVSADVHAHNPVAVTLAAVSSVAVSVIANAPGPLPVQATFPASSAAAVDVRAANPVGVTVPVASTMIAAIGYAPPDSKPISATITATSGVTVSLRATNPLAATIAALSTLAVAVLAHNPIAITVTATSAMTVRLAGGDTPAERVITVTAELTPQRWAATLTRQRWKGELR